MNELYTCNGVNCVWSRSRKRFSFKKINLNIVCNESACLNANIKHVASKSNTCLVLRYYLARLHRKTKCYSKSVLMLTLSVKLLLAYKYGFSWNGEQGNSFARQSIEFCKPSFCKTPEAFEPVYIAFPSCKFVLAMAHAVVNINPSYALQPSVWIVEPSSILPWITGIRASFEQWLRIPFIIVLIRQKYSFRSILFQWILLAPK